MFALQIETLMSLFYVKKESGPRLEFDLKSIYTQLTIYFLQDSVTLKQVYVYVINLF